MSKEDIKPRKTLVKAVYAIRDGSEARKVGVQTARASTAKKTVKAKKKTAKSPKRKGR